MLEIRLPGEPVKATYETQATETMPSIVVAYTVRPMTHTDVAKALKAIGYGGGLGALLDGPRDAPEVTLFAAEAAPRFVVSVESITAEGAPVPITDGAGKACTMPLNGRSGDLIPKLLQSMTGWALDAAVTAYNAGAALIEQRGNSEPAPD